MTPTWSMRAISIGPLVMSMASASGSSRTATSRRRSRPTTPLLGNLTTIQFWTRTDYSDREFEATLENIKDAAWKLKNDFDLPEGWESEVYSWLSDNRCGEIENTDDQGGYPSEEALREAFDALGFEPSKDTAST